MKLKQKSRPTPKSHYKFDMLYLMSFLLPALILFIIFVIRKIYPFGERSFLHIDMYHQYFPFLVEFYHKLKTVKACFIPGIRELVPIFLPFTCTTLQARSTGSVCLYRKNSSWNFCHIWLF